MFQRLAIPLLTAALIAVAVPARADDYTLEGAHTAVNFKISHVGISYSFGRFNEVSGNFTIADDPAKCSFTMSIKVDSIDTANKQRDNHLRSPDFFNAKQFPTI